MGKPGCGGCHPGGGGFEFDRDGKRYDTRLKADPSLRTSLDGDYFKSHWDKTGIIEADCFICHLEDYNFKARNKHLKLWNFKWAGIAASGIGVVKGTVAKVEKVDGKPKKVLTGQTPQIAYNKRLFDQNGKLNVDLSWPTPSRNCTFCHAYSDRKKRGFSWNDPKNHDIHNLSGMECVHCHPMIDKEHNFAKGDENISSVRDDLDGKGMVSCQECHERGLFGASRPEHKLVRPSHLEKISCETCHIPVIRANTGSYFDTTNGKMNNYGMLKDQAELTMENASEAKPLPIPKYNTWIPVQMRNHKTHKIEPVNPFPRGLIYSNLDADGIYKPLFQREIGKAYAKVKDQITKQPFDKGPFKGLPKLYKEDEIKLFLTTLAGTLDGNQRFKQVKPVMHKFGDMYYLDDSGNLVKEEDHTWAGHWEAFNINHNVSPANEALGAKGCTDCHSWDGKVFRNLVLTKLWNEEGKPEFIRNGKLLGCSTFSFWLNTVYQTVITPYVSLLILLVVLLIIVHYTGAGPKGADLLLEKATIQRFSLSERWTHLARMLSFIALTFTGAIFFYNSTKLLEVFFDTQAQASLWHSIFGVIFIVASVISFKLWYKDAKFEEYDREWLQKFGGYFDMADADVHAPAGRLNAGQKIAFWWNMILTVIMAITGILLMFKGDFNVGTNCFITTIHGFFSILFVATILGHAYLGTLANPGTWRTMLDGKVGEKWAEKHHSEWYKQIKG